MLELLMDRLELIEERIAIARMNGHLDLVEYYTGLAKETQAKINKLI